MCACVHKAHRRLLGYATRIWLMYHVLQLAKLIVNSGGAAALVDYVADAQASA